MAYPAIPDLSPQAAANRAAAAAHDDSAAKLRPPFKAAGNDIKSLELGVSSPTVDRRPPPAPAVATQAPPQQAQTIGKDGLPTGQPDDPAFLEWFHKVYYPKHGLDRSKRIDAQGVHYPGGMTLSQHMAAARKQFAAFSPTARNTFGQPMTDMQGNPIPNTGRAVATSLPRRLAEPGPPGPEVAQAAVDARNGIVARGDKGSSVFASGGGVAAVPAGAAGSGRVAGEGARVAYDSHGNIVGHSGEFTDRPFQGFRPGVARDEKGDMNRTNTVAQNNELRPKAMTGREEETFLGIPHVGDPGTMTGVPMGTPVPFEKPMADSYQRGNFSPEKPNPKLSSQANHNMMLGYTPDELDDDGFVKDGVPVREGAMTRGSAPPPTQQTQPPPGNQQQKPLEPPTLATSNPWAEYDAKPKDNSGFDKINADADRAFKTMPFGEGGTSTYANYDRVKAEQAAGAAKMARDVVATKLPDMSSRGTGIQPTTLEDRYAGR